MTEAYNISSRLTFTSNAATVVADLFVQFEKLDRVITATQGGLGKLTSELRALGGGTRGITGTMQALERLGQVKMAPSVLENIGRVTSAARQLAEVQAAIARSATESAAAWRSMAQSAPRAAGGGGRGGGGRPPNGTGGGGRNGGPWPQAWRDDFQNAQADNRNFDQIRDNQRRQAEYENRAFDTRAAAAAKAAADRKREADLAAGNKYDADHYQAMQENAVRDARAKRGRMSHTDWTNAAMGAQMGGQAGVGYFERSLHESFDVDHVTSLLTQDDRMTPALMATARAKAEEVAKQVPGSTIASNLELIREGMRNYGDPTESIDSLLPFARAQLMLRLNNAKMGGAGNAADAMDALFKSIEDLGLDIDRTDPKHPHVSQQKLEAAVNLITRMTVGSQGGVDPKKLLAFVKQARAAGISMSEEGLKNYVGVMQSMTASRSGTALAGFFNQFLVGTMTENVFKLLQEQQIFDKSAVWEHGRVHDASKHLANVDLAKSDIVTWFQKTITPMLLKKGLLNTAADGALAVSKDAGRQTTGGLLAELAVAMAQIVKQRQNLDHTQADPYQHAIDTDPETKVLAFRTAENTLLVKMGDLISGPALKGMEALTDALTKVSDWATKNPGTAKDLALTAAGLFLVSKAAGGAGMVLFMGAPVVKGLGALASALNPFAAGGSAAEGLAGASTGLNSLAGSIAAFVARLSALALPLVLGGDTPGAGKPATPEQIEAAKRSLEKLNQGTGNNGGFLHDLGNWFHGKNPAAPNGGQPIPPAANPFIQGSLTQPPSGNVTFLATITLDGQAIAKNIEGRLVRSGSGPSGGSTGFDQRTIYSGGMAA